MQIIVVFDAEKKENIFTAERLGARIRNSLDNKWILSDLHPDEVIVIVKEKLDMEE